MTLAVQPHPYPGLSPVTVADKAAVAELRKKDVTASVVAGLFGFSPWISRYDLWVQRRGYAPIPAVDNDAVLLGQNLEPGIMRAFVQAKRFGLTQPRRHAYIHDSARKFGASPDYIAERDGEPMTVEIKHSGIGAWEELPRHYLTQLLSQMALLGHRQGAVAALHAGRTMCLYVVERDDESVGKILAEVDSFWEEVAADRAPAISNVRDARAAIALSMSRGFNKDGCFDCADDSEAANTLRELCRIDAQLRDANESAKALDSAKRVLIARLLEKMDKAPKAILSEGRQIYNFKSIVVKRKEHLVAASEHPRFYIKVEEMK